MIPPRLPCRIGYNQRRRKLVKRLAFPAVVVSLCAATVLAAGRGEGAESPAAPVRLSYVTWDYVDRKASTDLFIATARNEQSIDIQLENVPTDQYVNLVKTRVASGNVPDMVNIHGVLGGYGEEIARTGQFEDIRDLAVVEEYDPATLDANTLDGKLYYVSVSTNVIGVLYNKALFRASGVAVPRSLGEFVATCEGFKRVGITPIACSAKDAWTLQMIPFIAFAQVFQSRAPSPLAALRQLAAGDLKFTDPEYRRTMAIQSEWARRGYFQAGFLGTDVSVASAMVATGKAAMLVNGTWQQKAIMDANPAAEIGFFALPMNATGEQIMIPTMAQGGIALNAKGGKLPQARRALSLYLGTDIQTAVIRDIKGISTNRNVKVGDPFLAEVIAALRAGRPTAFWHGTFLSEDVNAVLRSGYQALLAGATTVDRLAEEAQRQLAEELAGRF